MNLHGIPRMTFDIDVVVPKQRESFAACRGALEGLGLACRLPIRIEDLAAEPREALLARNLVAVTFTDPNAPLREVDVLVAPPMPADEIVARAVVRESAELSVRVASLEDLVAMKRAAARAQDLADLRHLERLLGKRGRR